MRFALVLPLVVICAGSGHADDIPEARSFARPTDTFVVSKLSKFGSEWIEKCRPHQVWKVHCGVDVDLRHEGKEVLAAGDGVVRYAATFDLSGRWGDCVVVEHRVPGVGQVTTLYGHITIASSIAPGTKVEKGTTVLGSIDPDVSPPHLHFGVRLASFDASNDVASRRGALRNCNDPICGAKFPEHWTDPVAFLQQHTQPSVTETAQKALDEAQKNIEKQVEQKTEEYKKRLMQRMAEAIGSFFRACVERLAKLIREAIDEI